MTKRPKDRGPRSESRTLVDVTLACGHHAKVAVRDLPHIATVTPAPPLTLWDKIRRRKPQPILASQGLFVQCTECNEPHPVVR